MTAALAERPQLGDLDLPVRDGCEVNLGTCGKPVVAVAHWDPACPCDPNPQKVCKEHRDRYVRDLPLNRGWFVCRWCWAKCRLVRLEDLL